MNPVDEGDAAQLKTPKLDAKAQEATEKSIKKANDLAGPSLASISKGPPEDLRETLINSGLPAAQVCGPVSSAEAV